MAEETKKKAAKEAHGPKEAAGLSDEELGKVAGGSVPGVRLAPSEMKILLMSADEDELEMTSNTRE